MFPDIETQSKQIVYDAELFIKYIIENMKWKNEKVTFDLFNTRVPILSDHHFYERYIVKTLILQYIITFVFNDSLHAWVYRTDTGIVNDKTSDAR